MTRVEHQIYSDYYSLIKLNILLLLLDRLVDYKNIVFN